MANKGRSRHMAGLAAPKFFAIKRKEHKYVIKPNAGRHTLDRSISLRLALKKLELAKTASEAWKILKSNNVLVNGKPIQEPKFPVGLNDTIEIKSTGGASRITVDNLAKIAFVEVKKPDYDSQLYRVIGKYKARKGQIMIRLHDGSSTKAENEVKVNDSVIIDSKKNVKKVLKMDTGAKCLVISGVHVGTNGTIRTIKPGTEKKDASAVIAPNEGEEFETIIKNVMVTG